MVRRSRSGKSRSAVCLHAARQRPSVLRRELGEVYLRFYQFQDAMTQEARFARATANDVSSPHLRARSTPWPTRSGARSQLRAKAEADRIWSGILRARRPLRGIMSEINFNPHAREDLLSVASPRGR